MRQSNTQFEIVPFWDAKSFQALSEYPLESLGIYRLPAPLNRTSRSRSAPVGRVSPYTAHESADILILIGGQVVHAALNRRVPAFRRRRITWKVVLVKPTVLLLLFLGRAIQRIKPDP